MLARVPDRIPPRLPIGSSEWDAQNRTDPSHPMEDVQASTMTAPLPPLQTTPYGSSKCRKLTALKERTRVHRENNCLWWLQDLRHSLGNTKKTGKGSTMTTPILPLWDALCGSPKCCVLAAELTDLRKRMEGYYEEECRQKLQEEQDL
jgi:hypothetical protein